MKEVELGTFPTFLSLSEPRRNAKRSKRFLKASKYCGSVLKNDFVVVVVDVVLVVLVI